MLQKFSIWLKRIAQPDVFTFLVAPLKRITSKAVRPALAEDLRKIGVTALGVGLIGIIVDNVSISRVDALLVFAFGAIIWVLGLWMSGLNPTKE